MFCCFTLKVGSTWMGLDYAISIFERIILIPQMNNQSILREMMNICASSNNFPKFLNYYDSFIAQGYSYNFKFEYEMGEAWGKSQNPIGMLLNITKVANLKKNKKLPEVFKNDINLMENLLSKYTTLINDSILEKLAITEKNIRSFRSLFSFINQSNRRKNSQSHHSTWVAGYLNTCITYNQIRAAKECILIFDFSGIYFDFKLLITSADIAFETYYKLLILCLESTEVAFGYGILSLIL